MGSISRRRWRGRGFGLLFRWGWIWSLGSEIWIGVEGGIHDGWTLSIYTLDFLFFYFSNRMMLMVQRFLRPTCQMRQDWLAGV